MTTVLHHTDILAGEAKTKNDFAEIYTALRQKEQRIYTDEEVASLPEISPQHIHYKEWQVRKRSAKRLIDHLSKKNTALKILEVGCGNGWLSSKLAGIKNSRAIGLDVNPAELVQAEKIFNKDNLRFLNAGINTDELPKNIFDIIVFAASIQYFNSLQQVLNTSFSFLKPGGEVHILDTNFYATAEIGNAAVRTRMHYASLGFPGMADHYFHHGWQQLKKFNHGFLYNPKSFVNRVITKQNAFPWIRVKP